MKNLILLCSICLMLFVCVANAQVHESWERIYDYYYNDDKPSSMTIDNAGNVYVTGSSKYTYTGFDYATIKYNSIGTVLWAARYNGYGLGTDEAHSIAVDNSGNVYVTGGSEGNGTGYDFATIKYNSSGVQQWVARYNYPANFNDIAFSLAIDNSGNIFVTGYSIGYGFWSAFTTIKYNSSGIVLWTRRYDFTANVVGGPIFVETDNLGNAYIAGPLHKDDGENILMIKYNSAGTQLWVRTYSGPANNDQLRHFTVDNSGNIYVTGSTLGYGSGFDMLTLKYSTSGNLVWQDRYGSPQYDGGYSIAVDNMGNVLVGGGYNHDFITIKYNSTGIKQWISKYNGPASGVDAVWELALDDSSNVYVTGISVGIGTGYDIATLKYNAFGVQQWRTRKPNPGEDLAVPYNGIAVDGNYNVYVSGGKMNSTGNKDYCTIKYSQQTRVSKGNGVSEIPGEFSLSQNFPNPFNPVTRISFDLPGESNTLLAVYDALGNQVSILVNEKLQPGTYSTEWDASGFSSGVYFYKLITEGYTETKKMILVK